MRKNSVIKLILSAQQINLYKAFQEHFQNLPDVEIVNCYFQDLSEFDCMVCAANSFGLMLGEVDLGIINFCKFLNS